MNYKFFFYFKLRFNNLCKHLEKKFKNHPKLSNIFHIDKQCNKITMNLKVNKTKHKQAILTTS